ncbi:hypothetical protein L915_09407 [Phytophthora nicotianae]|uniref:SWIM-type domain-containing protein n=1 Tax=Phytophthora nicotianae TaxID=4792 RepID=W2GSU3_PHYNI|nr:hypothetical protein L915_09407 [Phytophthora nicotianae]
MRSNSLRVIVVDKDLNEIKVLESDFPEARVLICHFHVIKYLNEKRSKPEFGKISGDDASQIDAAVHKIVYAESEEKYNEAHESLKGICERCGMNGFFQYFEKNWHSSTERWVYYLRVSLPHFGNHTNNRLESFFGWLKEGASRYMYEQDSNDTSVFLIGGLFKERKLRVDDWSCDCDFAASTCLPCRHTVAYRKHHNVGGPVIPWSRIDERWTNPTKELKKVRQFAY